MRWSRRPRSSRARPCSCRRPAPAPAARPSRSRVSPARCPRRARGGTPEAGDRPRLPPLRSARRRAARARSEEQGKGSPRPLTLAALLERAAHRRPHADAVVDGDRRLTYAELAVRTRALAEGFRRLGVARGHRVLLVLRNRLEHVLADWALQTPGGGPTPADFRPAPGELRHVFRDYRAPVGPREA